MYNIKTDYTPSVIEVKLRSKFIKAFPDIKDQEKIIRQCENLNQAPVHEVFAFLMKSAVKKYFLAKETKLELTTLTDEQCKIVWNEIRSQYNMIYHVFPEADLFENTCEAFVNLWEESSFDLAIDLFKSIVKYLDCHSQDEIRRALFLLNSDSISNHAGGFREIGYNYKDVTQMLKFHHQAGCLANGLIQNNCYLSALPLLQYFGCFQAETETIEISTFENEYVPEETIEISTFTDANIPCEETAEASTPTDLNTACEETLETSPLNESFKVETRFSLSEMVHFIENFELLTDFLTFSRKLRAKDIEPSYVIQNEEIFKNLFDSINKFKK